MNESEELYEMSGTVVEWNGRSGFVMTDCDERVRLHKFLLKALGFRAPIKVGDRIHFFASEHVEVTYQIEHIRLIDPREPDPELLRRLSMQSPDAARSAPTQRLTGVIESYDVARGYGYIRAQHGEQVLLHITCLRASGVQSATIGAQVEFEALQGARGWQACRLLSSGTTSAP